MKKLKLRRLSLLAWYLRSVPRQYFRLMSWVYRNGSNFDNGLLKNIECGATACAIGWAAHIPEFRKLGFELFYNGGAVVPSYKGTRNWEAVQNFFGLTSSEALHLFSMYSYPKENGTLPFEVANRIDKFVADYTFVNLGNY